MDHQRQDELDPMFQEEHELGKLAITSLIAGALIAAFAIMVQTYNGTIYTERLFLVIGILVGYGLGRLYDSL